MKPLFVTKFGTIHVFRVTLKKNRKSQVIGQSKLFFRSLSSLQWSLFETSTVIIISGLRAADFRGVWL